MIGSRTLSLLALSGLGLLIGAVGVVNVVPGPAGYEFSIYAAYPGVFWLLVIGAMLLGAAVIVGSARPPTLAGVAAGVRDDADAAGATTPEADGGTADRTWVFGYAIMVLTTALLLVLPYVRGYLLYGRADALSHVGYARDIASSGGVGGNIYPPMHLLATAVADATGLPLTTVGLVLPVIFSAVYFGGMYYVLVYLFDSRTQVMFGLPFVLLPVLGRAHVGFRPYDASLMFVPVVLYLFFKSQRTPTPSTRAAFVVVLIALLLYHPLTALFLIVIFTLYNLARYVPRSMDQYTTPTNLASLSAVLFLAWYSNFTSILLRFDSLYRTLFGEETGSPPVSGYAEANEEASPALIDIVQTATFLYGVDGLLFALGFLFLGIAVLLVVRKRFAFERATLMLGGTLVLFSLGGLAFLLLDLKVPHDRPFQIAKICAAVLIGQLFYLLLYRVDWIRGRESLRNGVYVFLIGTLVVLVALSTLSLYPSPLSSSSNSQVTHMEMAGAEWVAERGNPNSTMSSVGINYGRFHHARYGTAASVPFRPVTAPSHFNYTTRDRVGQSYTEEGYLTVTYRGRIVYPRVFPDYRANWRYTPAEFARLELDYSASRIYSSGDYTQYQVTPEGDE